MTEHHVRSRTVAAPPEQVFAVLADPAQHPFTEPTDWVRTALDPVPLTAEGQIFGIEMYFEQAGGRYEMQNKVHVFEPNRAIGWTPGQIEEGTWGAGGWWWRYDLKPVADGTEVTLTYDWSDVPDEVRKQFGGMPVLSPEYLDQSLEALERYVTQR